MTDQAPRRLTTGRGRGRRGRGRILRRARIDPPVSSQRISETAYNRGHPISRNSLPDHFPGGHNPQDPGTAQVSRRSARGRGQLRNISERRMPRGRGRGRSRPTYPPSAQDRPSSYQREGHVRLPPERPPPSAVEPMHRQEQQQQQPISYHAQPLAHINTNPPPMMQPQQFYVHMGPTHTSPPGMVMNHNQIPMAMSYGQSPRSIAFQPNAPPQQMMYPPQQMFPGTTIQQHQQMHSPHGGSMYTSDSMNFNSSPSSFGPSPAQDSREDFLPQQKSYHNPSANRKRHGVVAADYGGSYHSRIPDPAPSKKQQKPCTFFNSMGCKFGSKCKFLHVQDKSIDQDFAVCWDFNTAHGCSNPTCRWEHRPCRSPRKHPYETNRECKPEYARINMDKQKQLEDLSSAGTQEAITSEENSRNRMMVEQFQHLALETDNKETDSEL